MQDLRASKGPATGICGAGKDVSRRGHRGATLYILFARLLMGKDERRSSSWLRCGILCSYQGRWGRARALDICESVRSGAHAPTMVDATVEATRIEAVGGDHGLAGLNEYASSNADALGP